MITPKNCATSAQALLQSRPDHNDYSKVNQHTSITSQYNKCIRIALKNWLAHKNYYVQYNHSEKDYFNVDQYSKIAYRVQPVHQLVSKCSRTQWLLHSAPAIKDYSKVL
jgi:hypothetical protein